MEELKKRMSDGAVSADEIAEAFQIATAEGGQFYNGMEEASKTVSGMMSTLKDNANSLVGEVFTPLSESLLTELLPSAIGYIEQLSTAFKEEGVDGLVTAVGDILASIITKIAESAPDIIEMAVSVIQSFVDGLNDNSDKIGGSAAKIITVLIEGIISLLPSIAKLGLNLLLSLASGLADNLPTLIPTIVKTVLSIATYLINNLDKIYAAAIKLMKGLVKGIINSIPLVLAAIPKIINGMVKSFASLIPLLNDIGKNLIEGIWKGIDNAGEWLRNKISGFFGGVVDNIKDFFGIHSPSTLMAEMGMYLDQGMAKGIEDNVDTLRKATKIMGNAITDETKKYLKEKEMIDKAEKERVESDAVSEYKKRLDEAKNDIEVQRVKSDEMLRLKKNEQEKTLEILKIESEQAEENRKKIVESYEKLVTKVDGELSDLQKRMESYSDKLKPSKLFEEWETEEGEKGIELVDLRSEIRKLENFKENLGKLEEIDIAPEFLEQIKQIGGEEGNKFAELLLDLPEKQRDDFIKDYKKLGELANETTAELYKTEGKNIKDSFYNSIDEIVPGMFSKGKTAGEEYYQGFIEAISGMQTNVIPSKTGVQGNQASLSEITGSLNELSKNMRTTHVTEKVYTLNGSELMRMVSTLAKGGERLIGKGLVT